MYKYIWKHKRVSNKFIENQDQFKPEASQANLKE